MDRCDPAVVAMLGFCARKGYDIRSASPVSADLIHNISEYASPLLSKKYRRDPRISIEAETAPRSSGMPDGVGAVIGPDIDHMHTIWRYAGDPALGLTHLIRYSDGSDPKDAPSGHPKLGSGHGDATVIDVVTNVRSLVGTDTDLFRDLSGAFLLKGLWSVFFVPIPAERSLFEDAEIRERLLLYLSVRYIRLMPEGGGRSGLQKFADMRASDLMAHCLYACSGDGSRNCGACKDCLNTLWAADACGCLDGFGEAFDVKSYRDERLARLMKLLELDETALLAEIKGMMASSGDVGYREACSVSSSIGIAENSLRIPISERKAILEKHAGISDRAARALARYKVASSDPKERSEGIGILEQGTDPRNRLMLADILSKSESEAERKKAFTICKKMASRGDPDAMLALGNMYLEGTAVSKSIVKSRSWILKAASRGNAEAGIQYASDVIKSGTDDEREDAFRICALLSDSGDGRAMELLGKMHLEGKGTAKDLKEAKSCFRRAADLGNDSSRVSLITALMGNGDEAESKEAFVECSRIFNEKQDPYATYLLSIMYLRGLGVEPDLDRSVELMNLSLENGDRIHYFTNYIFEMRREIMRLKYPRQYVNAYYKILESRGSWIGIYSRFKGKPFFPHGLLNIFISDRAVIGMSCTIYQNVTIGSNKMPGHEFKGSPVISDHVLIGAGANIIGAVTVGDHAVIAAGANVARDVPPGATVVCKSEILTKKSE